MLESYLNRLAEEIYWSYRSLVLASTLLMLFAGSSLVWFFRG